MNRILSFAVGVVALAAAAHPAIAADRAVKAAPAPMAAPIFDWSGFYGGIHGGKLWGRINDVITDEAGDTDGWIRGLLVGWNVQHGRFVFGLELDYGWADTYGDNDRALNAIKVQSVGHARVRTGIAADRLMVFVAAGATLANLDIGHIGPTFSEKEMMTGWTVGAGIDWAAWQNLILRLEYLYADYGDKIFDFEFGIDPHNIAYKSHIVRAALSWKFATGKAPVATGKAPVVSKY